MAFFSGVCAGFLRSKSSMTLYGNGNKIVTFVRKLQPRKYYCIFCVLAHYSTALPTQYSRRFLQSIFIPPLPGQVGVGSPTRSMDQDQYAMAENLHPEPQSYSYGVGLGAG